MFLTCSVSCQCEVDVSKPSDDPLGQTLSRIRSVLTGIPGVCFFVKIVTAQVKVDEGCGGLQKDRNGLAKTKHDQTPVLFGFFSGQMDADMTIKIDIDTLYQLKLEKEGTKARIEMKGREEIT